MVVSERADCSSLHKSKLGLEGAEGRRKWTRKMTGTCRTQRTAVWRALPAWKGVQQWEPRRLPASCVCPLEHESLGVRYTLHGDWGLETQGPVRTPDSQKIEGVWHFTKKVPHPHGRACFSAVPQETEAALPLPKPRPRRWTKVHVLQFGVSQSCISQQLCCQSIFLSSLSAGFHWSQKPALVVL